MNVTPKTCKKVVEYSVRTGRSLLVVGPPGVGKSEIVERVCKDLSAELLYIHVALRDPTDFKGLAAVVDGQAVWLPYGELKEMIGAQRLTVVFLDDLGQGHFSTQAALMQLLQAGRVEDKVVSEKVVFIGATNRRVDRAGVQGLLAPIKSRFRTILQLVPSLDDWVEWALENDLPVEGVAFVRLRPQFITQCGEPDWRPPEDFVNGPCPRTVAEALRHHAELERLGWDDEMAYVLFEGAAGEGFAVEYLSFLKRYRKLPDPAAILMDPLGVPVPDMNEPDGPGLMYAVSLALSRLVSPVTIASALGYVSRVPYPEYGVLMLREASKRNPDVTHTREFIEWATRHSALFA
jgi:hypothetical protein